MSTTLFEKSKQQKNFKKRSSRSELNMSEFKRRKRCPPPTDDKSMHHSQTTNNYPNFNRNSQQSTHNSQTADNYPNRNNQPTKPNVQHYKTCAHHREWLPTGSRDIPCAFGCFLFFHFFFFFHIKKITSRCSNGWLKNYAR